MILTSKTESTMNWLQNLYNGGGGIINESTKRTFYFCGIPVYTKSYSVTHTGEYKVDVEDESPIVNPQIMGFAK